MMIKESGQCLVSVFSRTKKESGQCFVSVFSEKKTSLRTLTTDTLSSRTLSTDNGFSLVELMVTMVVFVFVLAAGSQIFTALLTQFKQQSKIGETDIEGAVGLDIMRYDLANAGYGLPWNVQGGSWSLSNYLEAATTGAAPDPNCFNDAATVSGCTPAHSSAQAPRAIVSGPGAGPLNNSDYLVIKSARVADNQTAGKFTSLTTLTNGPLTTVWYKKDINRTVPSNQNINLDDSGKTVIPKAIVLSVGNPNISTSLHALVMNGTDWYLTYNNDNDTAGFAPLTAAATPNLIYAIDKSDTTTNNTTLRMPFNRADYYVKVPSTAMPRRCAPGTGILYKATVSHKDGSLSEMPLLDCVAYMYVDYWLDIGGDGSGTDWCQPTNCPNYTYAACPSTPATASPTEDISCLSDADIRSKLMEVRVYIVAQEGQKDNNYDFSQGGTVNTLKIKEVLGTSDRDVIFPATGNLSNLICSTGETPPCPEYKNYRWKVYTLVVQPNNLR
jgi:prepilin-type N-terminal cleavage/methylation domain-containing protein